MGIIDEIKRRKDVFDERILDVERARLEKELEKEKKLSASREKIMQIKRELSELRAKGQPTKEELDREKQAQQDSWLNRFMKNAAEASLIDPSGKSGGKIKGMKVGKD